MNTTNDTDLTTLNEQMELLQCQMDALLSQKEIVQDALLSVNASCVEYAHARSLHDDDVFRFDQSLSDDGLGMISINVGGRVFYTERDTLTRVPNTMLSSMFSGRHILSKDKNGHYFIDRDGKPFLHVLNYLRNQIVPKGLSDTEFHELKLEAEYYSIPGLVKELDRRSGVAQFAVLRYNETSNINHLSWQGATQPISLTKIPSGLFKCIDDVISEMDISGWKLQAMSGDSHPEESGWMFVFKKEDTSNELNYRRLRSKVSRSF
eukprot:TRINITY_DN122_c0_g1_i1.p1 TRINITY_DN122_c0_g1~~TRINITY_DN122_c0_g1_i1.p1  ORF type:complete len:264 (+),score=46.39 TRINITY_DN122_c0_g1_i1:303-1094(+)